MHAMVGKSAWVGGPGIEQTRATMARALFWLFVAGAGLALIGLALSTSVTGAETVGVLVACAVALGAAALIRFAWRRLPPWTFQALVGLGAVLVTAGIYIADDNPGSVQLLYIWVALYASYFFTRAQALAHVGLVGVLFAAVLPSTDGENDVARWLIAIGTLAGTAILVSELKKRLARRIAATRDSERELEQSLSILRSTLESTADGILVVDDEGKIVSFNGRFQEMWRLPDEVVDSRDDERALAYVLDQVADPEKFVAKVRELYDRPEAESRDTVVFKDGRVFERYSLPQRANDGRILGRVWSFRDVSDRERIQSRLRYLADHDMLTGLMNRRRFEEELERQVTYTARYQTGGAVLLLDLDDFKEINDTLGHRTGDAVISSIAGVLRGRLRESDLLARIGGDEFAILLPTADEEQAQLVATGLLDAVRDHRVVFGGHRVRMTTSIGIAVVGGVAAHSAEELLGHADVAMYDAKKSGRDRLSVYDRGARRALTELTLPWGERIGKALADDRFTLYAQPVLDLESGECSHYELLLRMAGEDSELLPPGGFLPSAERSGMVDQIDTWVMRNAVRLIAAHRDEGRDLRLEVNLSGRTIGDEGFLAALEEEIRSTTIDPANLVFEVTESAAISNLEEVRGFSAELTRLGCRFALDDFGAGFGSFHYLKYLPLDYLKIDGDFIANLPRNPTDQAVVRAIVDLSARLGKETIAEFVGDEQTLELVREYGVHFAQGYYVGRPGPISEVLSRDGGGRAAERTSQPLG